MLACVLPDVCGVELGQVLTDGLLIVVDLGAAELAGVVHVASSVLGPEIL